MNLKKHYDKLWTESIQKFRNNEFEFDALINAENDTRYGLTLLARPSQKVKQNIARILSKINAIAPNQYYYPNSDLHVTILSIISCYSGFSLNDIDLSDYQKIIQSAIKSTAPFKIQFRGLTASPSCILVQGFPESDQLTRLRNKLREKFNQSGVKHSIDKRYPLQTAHITIIRFREPFRNAGRFIDKVAELRGVYLGSCLIDQVELVGNDWYQQQEKVKSIAKFSLRKQNVR